MAQTTTNVTPLTQRAYTGLLATRANHKGTGRAPPLPPIRPGENQTEKIALWIAARRKSDGTDRASLTDRLTNQMPNAAYATARINKVPINLTQKLSGGGPLACG